MKVVNNINIKGKDYAISKIINSFLQATNINDAEQSVYTNDKVVDGRCATTKLCYESIYGYDNIFGFKKVEGISFCFNGEHPCCTAYKGLWYDNAMFIIDSSSIRQFGLDADGYNPASLDVKTVENYIRSERYKRITDMEGFVGRIIMRGMMSKIITSSGMKVQIPIESIVKSTWKLMFSNATNAKFYAELSSNILSSRNKGKDMSWYMYKIFLINTLINGKS